ncbi:MAG: carboxy terminal-processing peptidase [Candidatus Symbiodolus clandestinus]
MKNQLTKWTLAAGLLLTSCLYSVTAEAPGQLLPYLQAEPQHSIASRYITRDFTQKHYRPITLDNKFSFKLLERYLRLLDPQRNLLLLSEIQALAAANHSLVQELLNGNLDLAYQLYNRVQQRCLERYQYALTLIQQPHTFDTNDTFARDRSDSPWPVTLQELDELWQSRIKFEALNLCLANKSPSQIRMLLTQRYRLLIKRLSQANSEDVFSLFMNAFGSEIDPHTLYFSPCFAKQFNASLSLSMEGIGVTLQAVDEYVVVSSLIRGGPAANSKAVEMNDRIIGVAQLGKKIVDVVGWRLNDVVDLIRGPTGTQVCLEILPHEGGKPRQVTLTRQKIRLEDQAIKSTTEIRNSRKIGVLTLPSFYKRVADEVKSALLTFEKQQVAGVLVDLRGNGGGLLNEVIDLTSLLVQGPIVQIRDRQGKISVNYSRYPPLYYKKPIVVLVNHASASASEIFAAALQDYGRAIIVGEQTFGKGTVQQYHALEQRLAFHPKSLGSIQYTTQKYYRITGNSTQLQGVTPDIRMLPDSKLTTIDGESQADNALPWDNIPAAAYQPVDVLTPLLPRLRTQHQQRIRQNQAFGFIQQELEYYHAMKQKEGIISLNLQQRQQEIQQQEACRLAQANWYRQQQGKKPIKSLDELPNQEPLPDLYLEEGLAITQDVIALVQNPAATQAYRETTEKIIENYFGDSLSKGLNCKKPEILIDFHCSITRPASRIILPSKRARSGGRWVIHNRDLP